MKGDEIPHHTKLGNKPHFLISCFRLDRLASTLAPPRLVMGETSCVRSEKQ